MKKNRKTKADFYGRLAST